MLRLENNLANEFATKVYMKEQIDKQTKEIRLLNKRVQELT